ncbi:hypothetical protein Pint_05917 [Pistacia integerrima]|uniref:Uncharacterized protein n=1 Tax=Pistacia integerrima TaxID=434235 RepID=A0ACC0Z273_9ROSI|nr:hypothetical protein Pint_05917 [Pistacia integerrima]
MSAKQIVSSLVVLALISSLVFSASAKFLDDKILDEIKKVNKDGPYLGLITVYPPEAAAFDASGIFVKESHVDLSGRRFWVGKVNAAAATQQMIDFFNISGIVHFGIAGSLNKNYSYGDVVVLKRVANTGNYDWLNPKDNTSHSHVIPDDLIFGNYSQPKGGDANNNSLGLLGFRGERYFSVNGVPDVEVKETWFNSTKKWVQLARKLEKTVELNGKGLPQKPKVVVGVSGSTADLSLENFAYREFLHKEFNVSSHDAESLAVLMVSSSNGYNVIAIRGLSDLSGADRLDPGKPAPNFRDITANNTVAVVRDFIKLLRKYKKA